MGGWGSGRKDTFCAKNTVDGHRAIDVRYLNREGLLKPDKYFRLDWSCNGQSVANIFFRTEQNKINLMYKYQTRDDPEWINQNYPVYLDWTECHLGGKRPWFRCPVVGCGRRVALIYGGKIFACRHCHQLVYPSQRETLDSRIVRRADKIRDRLGWEPGILNHNGPKPTGMHWKTFEALAAEHDRIVQSSLARMAEKFNVVVGSDDDLIAARYLV